MTAHQLSTVIMAHPSRLTLAEALADRLAELKPDIVVDPEPHGSPSSLRTAAVAWSFVPEHATHHMVLQDDAVPCQGFADAVHAAIAQYPDTALALFTEWTSNTAHHLRLAALTGATWAEVVDEYVPSVALVLPAAIARDFGQAATANLRAWTPTDDVALMNFLRERQVTAICRIPNLIDHDSPDSLTGNTHQGPRRSACFADDVPAPAPGDLLAMADLLPTFAHYQMPEFGSQPYHAQRKPIGDGGLPWSIRTTGQWLADTGLDPARVTELARAHTDQWRRQHHRLVDPLLDRLWLTPFAVGACLAAASVRLYRPDGTPVPSRFPAADEAALETLLADPVTRRAFTTLPQAHLHPVATRDVLDELEQPLTELMLDAVRAGYRHARENGRR
ncbi:hypothetical protein [Catellatospora sichuanensis]|uniref:hypothetical protein n=1 Tax=Catellatospora sichuanensis TaxID=1969805 RepID=UPI00118388E4|nr:hypothetical protein [Catellatospora sichuanensis]